MIGSIYILCRKDLWNSFYASEYINTKSKGVKSMSPYERYLEMDRWYKRQYVKMRIKYFFPDLKDSLMKILKRLGNQ